MVPLPVTYAYSGIQTGVTRAQGNSAVIWESASTVGMVKVYVWGLGRNNGNLIIGFTESCVSGEQNNAAHLCYCILFPIA